MMFSDFNMHLLDESADNINSATADLLMRVCTIKDESKSSRRKRSIPQEAAVAPQKDIEIELPLKNLEKITVNATTDDKYGMLYHKFNISVIDPLPVLISFHPSVEGMILYAALDRLPVLGNYQWSTDGNTTLFLSSEELSGNLGTLNIGVGFQGMCKPLKYNLEYDRKFSIIRCC
jgi:hypothetical protein